MSKIRKRLGQADTDQPEVPTAPARARPALPEAMRARAGAEEGRMRAAEGRLRKERRREARANPPVASEARVSPEAPRKGANSKDVEKWIREALWEAFGRKFIIPAWPQSCHQRVLSKMLLAAYGEDMTKRAIVLFCQTWDQKVAESGGRLAGVPTINLIWGMRERIFAEVQMQGRKVVTAKVGGRDSDEFRGDQAVGPGLGWG